MSEEAEQVDLGGRLPLVAETVIRTTERELALEAANQSISPMHVEFVRSSGRFQFQLSAIQIGRMGLRALHQVIEGGMQAYVEPTRGAYTIEIPLLGAAHARHLRHEAIVAPSLSAFITSPHEATEWRDDGLPYSALSIELPRASIDSKFVSLTGNTLKGTIAFEPAIDLRDALGHGLCQTIRALCDAVEPRVSIYAHPATTRAIEDVIVTALLTAFDHSHREALEVPAKPSDNKAIMLAEDFLAAHFDEPVALEEVANEAGISVRSLQRTFRSLRGVSPMRFLKDLRLDAARDRLLHFGIDKTVTEIAFGCGFTHLGAFAADYKQRFGETPSQTQRRSADR
jgi:AraC-like DNA-binding protein